MHITEFFLHVYTFSINSHEESYLLEFILVEQTKKIFRLFNMILKSVTVQLLLSFWSLITRFDVLTIPDALKIRI